MNAVDISSQLDFGKTKKNTFHKKRDNLSYYSNKPSYKGPIQSLRRNNKKSKNIFGLSQPNKMGRSQTIRNTGSDIYSYGNHGSGNGFKSDKVRKN